MDTSTPGNSERIGDVLKKIERTRQARRHKFYLRDEKITLSHGSGGKATHNLIEALFAQAFANPLLDKLDDGAVFAVESGFFAVVRFAFLALGGDHECFQAQAFRNGYFDQTAQLWNEAGELLATTHQVVYYKE